MFYMSDLHVLSHTSSLITFLQSFLSLIYTMSSTVCQHDGPSSGTRVVVIDLKDGLNVQGTRDVAIDADIGLSGQGTRDVVNE